MIVVLHHNNTAVKVLNEKLEAQNIDIGASLAATFFSIAKSYPDELILWCHKAYVENLNFTIIDQIFHHRKMMVSYSVANKKYLSERIGYVEDSPFIKVKYDVSYPTWLMSSDVGGIHSEVLNSLNYLDFPEKNFNLFLNSIAKTTMSSGLFCYSNPSLLQGISRPKIPVEQVSNFELFKFIKQHYNKGWVFFNFVAVLLYEKKLFFLSLIISLFYKKKTVDGTVISEIRVKSNLEQPLNKTIDVIIPTIGRKKYLYDVLMDLSVQTVLPKRVIIVEQNPIFDSTSALDYLHSVDWPFIVVHRFIHQMGACNARNLAIAETKASFVFFADDDNRLQPEILERALKTLSEFGAMALTSSYLRKNEKKTDFVTKQWSTFGAGNSFVQGGVARSIKFDMRFEHGYGEDADYGMKLRNSGVDVIYHPFDILHLKAPIGGFRDPVKKPWDTEEILPKPSPTLMLYRSRHTTQEQLQAYKLIMLIKYYKKQHVKNPFAYIQKINKAWSSSLKWANKLNNK